MPPNENYDFNIEKQRAAERLRELNARSRYHTNRPPYKNMNCDGEPHLINGKKAERHNFLSELGIPFLGDKGIDSDIALVLGLVLILTSENSDRLLLLALLYILI